MKLMVNDIDAVKRMKRMIRHRQLTGADRFDEVWNGVYVMSPLADYEHMELAGLLLHTFYEAIPPARRLTMAPGANVSDRREGWIKNYRVPDIIVFLKGNRAELLGTHWSGGPDFAVEILSPRDRARKKFRFYAKVGVKELLLVARDPWRLELYRTDGVDFDLVGSSDLDDPQVLSSPLLDLTSSGWQFPTRSRRSSIRR